MARDWSRNMAVLGMFLASGCSALIYEIVWLQQLSLVLGASAVSLAILLASFMGGMCLGSLGFARFVSLRVHPLRVYAILELIIAICGLATLWLFSVVGRVYCDLSLVGTNDLIARSIVALVLLLPPTIMMGATLPAVSRWVESTAAGVAWLGWFYGANTLGAMVGSLLAGMYLLRVYDVVIATWFAFALNCLVALVAYRLSGRSALVGQAEMTSVMASAPAADVLEPGTSSGFDRVIQFVTFLSGLTSLGAEVIWTRHLGLLLGPTVYTFSVIVSVYLLGLAIGSSAGAWIGRRVRSPAIVLALSQLLLLIAIPHAASMIVNVLPSWLALRDDEKFGVRLARDIVRTMAAILPATCLWGASFPLAVAALARRRTAGDPSQMVGGLYAANTLGAIVGSLGVSLYAIHFGGQAVQRSLTGFSGLAGITMLAAAFVSGGTRPTSRGKPDSKARPILAMGTLLAALIGTVVAWWRVPVTPVELLADGRFHQQGTSRGKFLYVAEGLDSPIVISEAEDGTRFFHVAGKVEASTIPADVRTQRLLGHLPALAHPAPKKILVVGCGSGMTAGSFLLHPTVAEIVLCEMEQCVIEGSRDAFAEYNYDVLRDPKTRIVHDDARHFLATTRETFDVITTDPIHPWVKGAATLYTAEFFELCKRHLNPDGVVTLWVPLYESSEETVKCEMATFLAAFPSATIWSGESFEVGYDVVVVASAHGQPMDVARIIDRMTANEPVRESFGAVGLGSSNELWGSFAATGDDLRHWLAGAQINRDRNLRLQYLAGTSSDDRSAQEIFRAMTAAHESRETITSSEKPPE